MTPICIPPDMIDDVWFAVKILLGQGLDAAGADRVETARSLLCGKQLLWIIAGETERTVRAVWLTEILELDGAKRIVVSALAGNNPASWASVIGQRMAAYATEEGAASVRFCGKRGWARLLPDYREIGQHSPGVQIFERAAA